MSAIKLLADENIAAPMVQALRSSGWDVTYIAEIAPGTSDDAVLSLANEQGRILLTEDKDFGELVIRMKKDIAGVILIRLPSGSWHIRWQRLQAILDAHAQEFCGKYVVVEKQRLRMRPLFI